MTNWIVSDISQYLDLFVYEQSMNGIQLQYL